MTKGEGVVFSITEIADTISLPHAKQIFCEIIVYEKVSKTRLAYLQWELLPFINWFIAASEFWNQELDIISDYNCNSLAQAIDLFYKNLDPNDEDVELSTLEEEKIDLMFKYREMHSFRFGLSGARFPNIIIGKFKGVEQISLYNEIDDVYWAYEINLNDFITSICRDLVAILENRNDCYLLLKEIKNLSKRGL